MTCLVYNYDFDKRYMSLICYSKVHNNVYDTCNMSFLIYYNSILRIYLILIAFDRLRYLILGRQFAWDFVYFP